MKFEDRIIEKIIDTLIQLTPEKRFSIIYATICGLLTIVIIISVLLMLWIK